MRNVDDNIVYALNTSIPTESFKGQLNATTMCTDLYGKLNSMYDSRNKMIKNCITTTANRVKELKVQKDNSPEDINLYKNFKSEQRKVGAINRNKKQISWIQFKIVKTNKIFLYSFFLVANTAVRIKCWGHNQRAYNENFLWKMSFTH